MFLPEDTQIGKKILAQKTCIVIVVLRMMRFLRAACFLEVTVAFLSNWLS